MELVDRYLQAVRFWLPKGQQQDLTADLSEDLHSQIEEKESELGRSLDEQEISAILKRCGNPLLVAGRFRPQQYLIGPALYPIYEFVLKMVLLWILVPIFLFIVGPVNLANHGDWGIAIVHTMGALWSGAFGAAAVITLVFAVIERTQTRLGLDDKWNPRSLPPLQKQERKPSLLAAVCEIGFGIAGLIWLLLVPHNPFLILGPAAAFLKATPLLHTIYVPILLLGVIGIVRSMIILVRPHWTWFPPSSQLANTLFTLVILRYIIKIVTHAPASAWQPFVMVADGIQDPVHAAKIAAVVNVSILVSLASAWLGLCIAAVVQTWQLLRYFDKRAIRGERSVRLQTL